MNVGSKIWKKIKEQGLGTEIKVFLDNWWSRGVMFVKRLFLKHFLNKLAQENRPKPFTIFLLENKFIKTQSLKDL